MAKDDTAFRTISEVTGDTGVSQHILRYWETRFPELRPLQRAGNRRYYRPADVDLVRRIDALLNRDGYTIKGVQKLLADGSAPTMAETPEPATAPSTVAAAVAVAAPDMFAQIRDIRDSLKAALAADAA